MKALIACFMIFAFREVQWAILVRTSQNFWPGAVQARTCGVRGYKLATNRWAVPVGQNAIPRWNNNGSLAFADRLARQADDRVLRPIVRIANFFQARDFKGRNRTEVFSAAQYTNPARATGPRLAFRGNRPRDTAWVFCLERCRIGHLPGGKANRVGQIGRAHV